MILAISGIIIVIILIIKNTEAIFIFKIFPMLVFATRYNLVYHLDKIINRQINPEVNEYIIENLLFNRNTNKYLSDYSISQCYYLVEFLSNPEQFILKHGKIVIDEKDYYERPHPAYHKNEECDLINSDFKNIVIPERVRNNDAIVNIIRSAPKEILDKEKSKAIILDLCTRLNKEFNIIPPLEEKDFIKVDKNTGPNMLIENDIQALIDKTEQLHAISNDFLSNKSYLLDYKSSNFKPPLYEDFLRKYSTAHKSEEFVYSNIFNDLYYLNKYILMPIKIRLRYYTIAKIQGHFKFENSVLDTLGFHPCTECYGRTSSF